MKFYGHANLQQNELQNAVLSTLTSFPANPGVGQIAFLNRTVYICVQNNPAPAIWVPLTREITAYTHTQTAPMQTWNITHGLNTTSVNIQVFDGGSAVIIPDAIETTGPNTASVTLSSAMAGRAVVVSGSFDGNVKPTYAYTHYQSSASSTWTILHSLGYFPIVRVFIGNNEVQPEAVTHDSVNQVTITFTSPQVGYARLI
jgi:hypothetical protein